MGYRLVIENSYQPRHHSAMNLNFAKRIGIIRCVYYKQYLK